jgi:hypothetical protein
MRPREGDKKKSMLIPLGRRREKYKRKEKDIHHIGLLAHTAGTN